MEYLFFGLVLLAIPAAGVAGFFMALGLRTRTETLEKRLAEAEAQLKILARGIAPGAVTAASPVVPEGLAPDAQGALGTKPGAVPWVAAGPPAEIPEALRDEPESFPAAPPEPAAAPPIVPPIAAAPPKPRKAGLEEQLGTRWTVWVGGLALGLGGLFMVRYSIEQGLLGPGARVTFGILFAAALLAAGEFMRRRGPVLDIPTIKSAHIPGILTAAGTSTAFATVYSAYALYGMIGPASAFVLLGLIAVLTLLAATLHGPALGGLGLVAALGSPLLVESDAPQLWPLTIYLAFVVAAAYGVARLRLWRWLAVAGAAGAILWTPLLMLTFSADVGAILVHVLVQSALAGLFLVADPHRQTADADAAPDRLANLVLLAFAAAGVLVTVMPEVGTARPFFAGALALLLLGLGVRFAPAAGGAVAAAVSVAGTLAIWPAAALRETDPPQVLPDPIVDLPRPEAINTYLAFATIMALAIAAAALWRLARGRGLPLATAGLLAGAATVGPLVILIVAYGRVARLDQSVPFALAAGLLGLGFAGAAGWLRQRESEALDAIRLGVGATASAAVAAVALGLTFALERGMLTVAFGLAALGTAWVADRVGIRALRFVVGAIALLVLARLVWDPTLVRGDLGTTPIFNWLLWGYGVPALAFFFASRILERGGRDGVVRLVESLAIACAAFLVIFEIRHALYSGNPLALEAGHIESGLLAASGLLFSLVLLRVNEQRSDIVYHVALLVFSGGSLITGVFGLGLANNPLLTGEAVVGGAVLNSLLLAYAFPALLAAILAWQARRSRPLWYQALALALAFVLQFLFMVAEIRHLFRGPVISLWRSTSEGELWAYSVALLAVGIALLAIGLVRNIRLARLASAGYIFAAVGKVFLVDLSNLEGAMRALSFIGLGLTLVGIGLAYQRLLARTQPVSAKPPEPAV
jgi:uncharacterized membrane protein